LFSASADFGRSRQIVLWSQARATVHWQLSEMTVRDFETLGRSLAVSTHGMAATSHPQATLTAVDILRAGGTAMDAAIAACAVQCVVEPGSTGLGGDCFVLYARDGSDDVIAYNGSGRAPAGATREKISALVAAEGCQEIPRQSPHAVTIPGAVDAWAQLAADHGRLGLAALLAPAIDLARNGYAITPRVHADWSSEEALLQADPAAARMLLTDGRAPRIGERHQQPELATTLARIAAGGAAAFYAGEVASDMVERLQQAGGLHTLQDFASHRGAYVQPIETSYRGHRVLECPPNGQGLIALVLLNVLQSLAPGEHALDPVSLQLEIEATRLAYSLREALLCDPDHPGVPVDELLSARFTRDLVSRIKPGHIIRPLPDWQDLTGTTATHRDTVYITVVDKDRNAASFINSVFWTFGSGIMAPRSGVMLQNRGMSFSLQTGHPNAIAPGKRPMHTIIPGMLIKDGKVRASFGVMGGNYQAMGHAWLLRRVLDDGLDLQAAMDLPRLFPIPGTETVEVEQRMPAAVRDHLSATGYTLIPAEHPIGGSQAIMIDWHNNTLTGASEPRKDGMALGY
jgi:gamma-glutamyltranspeptidase / glutathione hydrolase